MCVIVGTIRESGMAIEQEYRCKGGKCNVKMTFIVRDNLRCRQSTSTVQDTVADVPADPQAVESADNPAVIEDVLRPTPSVSHMPSRPASRANPGHVSTKDVREGPHADTEHNAAEGVPKDHQPVSLSDIVHKAAADAKQIKSIHDCLGSSVNYLEGVMNLGKFISEVSPDWIEMLIDLLSFIFHGSIPP